MDHKRFHELSNTKSTSLQRFYNDILYTKQFFTTNKNLILETK